MAHNWESYDIVEKYIKNNAKVWNYIYTPFADKVESLLMYQNAPHSIVDLSCGPGFLSIELANRFPDTSIIGIDPSLPFLQYSDSLAKAGNISNYSSLQGMAEEIPLQDNSVDVVVTFHSYHDWNDQAKGIKEIKRILKNNGILILSDYNPKYPEWKKYIKKLILRIRLGKEISNLIVRPGKKGHEIHTIINILEKNGLFVDLIEKNDMNLIIKADKNT